MLKAIAKLAIGGALMEVGKHIDRRDTKVRVNGKEVSTGTKTFLAVATFAAGVMTVVSGANDIFN
uniref:Uncharacterized protein n=1 Tax=Pseudomonas phage RVTF4 TaxID=3236931 RepID=A0AB39CD43_9VIRU